MRTKFFANNTSLARVGNMTSVARPPSLEPMHDALTLFESLTDEDQDWLLDSGVEHQLIANSQVITEGVVPTAMYVVLEGLVAVTTKSLGAQPLAQLGPGQIFGEMSFLENAPAIANVAALENSLLLEIPFAVLRARTAADAEFGMRLFRAIALFINGRLRHAVHDMGRLWSDAGAIQQESNANWDAIASGVDAFKALMTDADKDALKNDGVVSDEFDQQIRTAYDSLVQILNEKLGDGCGLSEDVRSHLGHRIQSEMLPYIHTSELGERIYAKPRGYAGDYLTIAIMYGDVAEGVGRTGAIIDRATRDQPACKAVINRRGLLAREIGRSRAECSDDVARITSLASGPATELFDVFASLDDPKKLSATCIDIDNLALEYVEERCAERGLREQFQLHCGNLVYLASGRKKLDLPPQDLVYSIGLIDYFGDKFVVRLLNYVCSLLKPGGRVILGNFHADNPSKALMDYILDWKLKHRTEEDMNRLFAASAFGSECTHIHYEDEGVNMFAECRKSV